MSSRCNTKKHSCLVTALWPTSESPIECKRLRYQINGVDCDKWTNEGYEVCYDGIRKKFTQNPVLLAMLRTTTPKILVEATTDQFWVTGIPLHDNCTLDKDKWTSTGWLSRMLLTIRDEHQ